jgi:hypothetical protein
MATYLKVKLFGKKQLFKEEDAQLQPLYYTTIDGTAAGIKAKDVSFAIAGDFISIKKIYIGLAAGATVQVKSPDEKADGSEISGSPYFSAGQNPVPVKEVVQDPSNPTAIDIYY